MDRAEKLIALYSTAPEKLLEQVRLLEVGSWNRRRKEELLRQIDEIINQLTGESGQQMALLLGDEYMAGVKVAIADITSVGVAVETLDVTIRPLIHQRSVQEIMDESFYSILEASEHMSRDTKQRIEDAVRTANERSLIDGVNRRKATRDAVADLNSRGITGMIAKNGAQIPADKYMAGVVHYHQRKAHVTGTENMATQNGYDLVYVNFVGITCEYCATMQGRVYSISGKDKRFPKLEIRPPYHSHCVHSLSVWVEEYTPPEEVEKMIRESNRPFTDNRTEHNIKRYKELQTIKSRKNATRKQWIKYMATFPDAPDLKTFASQKARNTKAYRKLQEDYRLANAKIKKEGGSGG